MNQLIKHYPNLKPEQLTSELIIQWRKLVLIKAKAVTWNNYARHLRSLYNFAIEYEFININKNPFSKMFITEEKGKKKILTDDQLNKIHAFISSYERENILSPNWFIVTLIQTFRYTGLRRSQLIKLRICDIDLERKVICIPSNINKNHNYHEIPISKKLLPHLEKLVFEMIKICQTKHSQLFNINKISKYVTNKSRDMTLDQLGHIFKVISDNVGFQVSSHRFRHTIATQLMKNVDNVYNVKQLLGHSDIRVTLSYIEYSCEMIRACVDNL